MIEHERSYIFTYSGVDTFLQEQQLNVDLGDINAERIEDYYLRQGLRVRKSWKSNKPVYLFTRKTGNKADGYRFEFEEEISEDLALALLADVQLLVKKTRHVLEVSNDSYLVTLDIIEKPMKIAVIEIEARNEISYPVPLDITNKIFGVDLKECPLCAFSLFNRRIGICGGPSSGKSETAKILSHVLNTNFRANAFHVAEFATTFIQKYNRTPGFWEEFFIWHGQHDREHRATTADIILSDCPTFLTYIYLLHLPKEKFSSVTALVLAKIYKRALFDIDWYSDIVFLELQEYKQNNVRYQTEEEAKIIENRIKMFLDDHHISYGTYSYSQSDKILADLFFVNC